MTKSELKNGAVVELKDGTRYIKIDNTLLNIADFSSGNGVGHMSLCNYTEDLKYISGIFSEDDWDIVKVNNNATDAFGHSSNAINEVVIEKEWTWIKSEPILDDVERKYLSIICKPYKVICIAKFSDKFTSEDGEMIDMGQYIVIRVANAFGKEDFIYLPAFKTDTMYRGMKLCREYTPEELEI